MESSPRSISEKKFESGYFEGKRYNVDKLYAFAESLPVEEIPIEEFRSVISAENDSHFKIDDDDRAVRPHELVRDWEVIKDDPKWQQHADSIRNVALELPILVSHTGHVIDGQHRVIRSFIEGRPTIRAKRLPEIIPAEFEEPTEAH